MQDMEERLEVLTSPEADEARQWLAHFFATRRNPEAQLRAQPAGCAQHDGQPNPPGNTMA